MMMTTMLTMTMTTTMMTKMKMKMKMMMMMMMMRMMMITRRWRRSRRRRRRRRGRRRRRRRGVEANPVYRITYRRKHHIAENTVSTKCGIASEQCIFRCLISAPSSCEYRKRRHIHRSEHSRSQTRLPGCRDTAELRPFGAPKHLKLKFSLDREPTASASQVTHMMQGSRVTYSVLFRRSAGPSASSIARPAQQWADFLRKTKNCRYYSRRLPKHLLRGHKLTVARA